MHIVEPRYPIAQVSKAQIKFFRSLQQKKYRDEWGMFVAEGHKCIEELCKAFSLEYLITEQNATATDIAQISSLRTPQGVIGIFRQTPYTTMVNRDGVRVRTEGNGGENIIGVESKDGKSVVGEREEGLMLMLDGIQDPGNLGTIIRTADWFGVHAIICSKDTADCFNPKVVQSTMGALARVHLSYCDLSSYLEGMVGLGLPIYGTLLNGRNLYEHGAITDKERGIIIMGNEGNGISAAVRRHITHPLLIPSYPADSETSESLNVAIATAITLAEFRRR